MRKASRSPTPATLPSSISVRTYKNGPKHDPPSCLNPQVAGLLGSRKVEGSSYWELPNRYNPSSCYPWVHDTPHGFAIRRRAGRVWTVVPSRASGGIGRRAGFRFQCPRTWGFKSPLAHHAWRSAKFTLGSCDTSPCSSATYSPAATATPPLRPHTQPRTMTLTVSTPWQAPTVVVVSAVEGPTAAAGLRIGFGMTAAVGALQDGSRPSEGRVQPRVARG